MKPTSPVALSLLARRTFVKTGLAGLVGLGLRPSAVLGDDEIQEARLGTSAREGEWVRSAIKAMWGERRRSGVTPLIRLVPPFNGAITLYLKNEAASPTGSLKHRVAWALIMDALVNGRIGPATYLYEASSGNTAIGEAYFARLLGLRFTAVMRKGISEGKMQAIRALGGGVEVVADGTAPSAFIADALARDRNAYDLNQFANTARALDYFEGDPSASMNLANEVFRQLDPADGPCPRWFVAGAGSGGTATSIARYLRKWGDYERRACPAQLAVVDPEDSVLFDWYRTGDARLSIPRGSRIEGIGSRGPIVFGVTFSLLREGVARMMKVPDVDSVAAMHFVARLTGQQPGPSTGTNFQGALRLMAEMNRQGQAGSIVSIVCDDGARYRDNYYDPAWIKAANLEPGEALRRLEGFWSTGQGAPG
jgi:cysteine synthase A